MSDRSQYLAIDLGAESGRGIVVTLADGKVSMEEIHRWPNRPVRMAGRMYWDFPFLLAEVIESLKICKERNVSLASMGVDTWGVDFGLLGSDGRLLGNPVHYRDARTENIQDYAEGILPASRVFELTAMETWPGSSLMQLAAMKRENDPALKLASTFLNMPDLLGYFLTGVKAGEMSVANTSALMGTDCDWSGEILKAYDLPDMFPRLREPGTLLGPLSSETARQSQMGDLPVISTCGHDTSAAVQAVPGEGKDWAFMSCGTWSILGTLLDAPVVDPRCLELHWMNEYAIGGWYLAKNIIGLWLVQELKRKWDTSTDPWDYPRIVAEAEKSKTDAMINAADPALVAPADMEQALVDQIKANGQEAPETRGELLRAVLEALALEYAAGLDAIGEFTGTRPQSIYMVGGGIRNQLLCQLTADACCVPVYASADQCTALGNALGQAKAMGALSGPEEIRTVMRNSFQPTQYDPKDEDVWQVKNAAYRQLRARMDPS
jgi:rhamnulokinase